MGGVSGASNVSSTIPDDPDPTPMVQSGEGTVTNQARRQQQKRIAGNYGRQQSTIVGNNPVAPSSQTEQGKKNILGG